MTQQTFGEAVRTLRNSRGLSLRGAAVEMGMSPAYLSDIENNRRYAPVGEKLESMLKALKPDSDMEAQLMELTGYSRKEVAPDMTEFLRANAMARVIVRKLMQVSNLDREVIDNENAMSVVINAIDNLIKAYGGTIDQDVVDKEFDN